MQIRIELLRATTLTGWSIAATAAESSGDLISETEWNRSSGTPTTPTSGEVAGKSIAGIAASLVVVLFLVVALGWLVKRLGVRRLMPQKGRHLEVLDTVPLAFKRQVSLVRIGDQAVLVGVGEHELTHLATIAMTSLAAASASASASAPASGDAAKSASMPAGMEPDLAAVAPPAPPTLSAFAETLARRLKDAP